MLDTPASTAHVATSKAVADVMEMGRFAASRGWVPATSGNFSVRIDVKTIAITRSGCDKGSLADGDILIQPIDAPLLPGSSAEAALHLSLYRTRPAVGAIFHAHSLAAAVLGQATLPQASLILTGWELQKAITGVTSHEQTIEVPVFANDQDIEALSHRVLARWIEPPNADHRAPGYLLAGHGLYAHGGTPADAIRHHEALDAVFSQIITLRSLTA